MRGSAAVTLALAAWLATMALRDRKRRTAARRRSGADLLLALLAHLRRAMPRAVALLARRDTGLALRCAGLDLQIAPRDVAAARVACVLVAALVIPRLASTLPSRMLPIVVPALLWAAAELPMQLLARRAARRATRLRSALPDALDLLCACLVAGLALRRSLALVADHCAEPVAGEFAGVAAETAFGVAQATALDGLAARNPLPEVRALVSAIRQAERNGSPLAPVIAAQARDARLAHNRDILDRGARAGPKIQLVVSATIVPGALIGFAAILIAAIARGDLKLL